MTKLFPAVIITLFITGMSIFTVYQSKTITVKDNTIEQQAKEIGFLDLSLQNEIATNTELVAENLMLRESILVLEDSLSSLKEEMKQLKSTIAQKNRTIYTIKASLQEAEEKYKQLQMQIDEISRKEKTDQNMISSLEAEKSRLEDEISNLQQLKEQEANSKKESEAELLERQINEARMKRINNLVNNTKVNFNKITLSKTRFGKPITRIKKENSKWKYTVAEFFLEHEDLNLLLDEQFIVKIVNSDTGEILSYIESNPNFPDSEIDTKGVQFRFDGNMMEVSYFNNQDKAGANYEIQIFYISEGKEYLLLDGSKPFIIDQKVLIP